MVTLLSRVVASAFPQRLLTMHGMALSRDTDIEAIVQLTANDKNDFGSRKITSSFGCHLVSEGEQWPQDLCVYLEGTVAQAWLTVSFVPDFVGRRFDHSQKAENFSGCDQLCEEVRQTQRLGNRRRWWVRCWL